MSLGQTIRHGVKWSFLGNTGSHALQFLFGIVMARLLVPADFGTMVTIQAFTGFVGLIAAGGLGQSLIRAKQVDTDEFNAVFTLQLLVGVLIYVGFYVAAPVIGRYFDNPLYSDLLRVTAISFVIRPFASIRFAWLTRDMEFQKRSLIELAVGAIVGCSSVTMAWSGMGVWSLVFSGLVGAFATNVLLSFIVPLRLGLRWHVPTVRTHSRFGAKITVNELLNYLKEQAIYLIVSKSAGPMLLGLLTRGESLARLPNRFITPATGQVVFRAMSKVQDDLDQTRYLFHRTITLLTVYISPLLLIMMWTAEPLVLTLYGQKWLPAAEPMRILAIAGFFLPIGRPSSLVLQAQDRLADEMRIQLAALAIGIAACMIGLHWGLKGVAWCIVLTHMFTVSALYLRAKRHLRVTARALFQALVPAIILNSLLYSVLALLVMRILSWIWVAPILQLLIVTVTGITTYVIAFLIIPIPALDSERLRLQRTVGSIFRRARIRS